MIEFKEKLISDVDLINIIMMTRGRPKKLKRAIESLDELAVVKDKIKLWAYVDDDDSLTLSLIDSEWDQSIGFQVNWHISSRPITHGAAFTELWNVSSNAGIYMGFCDDYVVQTSNWDVVVRETFLNIPSDRIAVGYLSDPLMPIGGINFIVETAEWINQVGHFVVPYFPYWFGDIWLQQIAEMVDRKYAIPVNVWPMDGEKGKTHRLWDLSFWTRFFHLLLVERVETARGIIEALTSSDPAAKAHAIMHMHEKIAEYEKVAEDELTSERLEKVQSNLSHEIGQKDATYLKAFRQGESHLKAMQSKIQDFQMQQLFWNKKKVFAEKFSNND